MVGALTTTKYHFNFAGKALFKCYHCDGDLVDCLIVSRENIYDDRTGKADKTSIQACEPISFLPENTKLCNSNTLSKNQCNK